MFSSEAQPFRQRWPLEAGAWSTHTYLQFQTHSHRPHSAAHKRNINKYDVHVKRRLPYLLKFWFLFTFFDGGVDGTGGWYDSQLASQRCHWQHEWNNQKRESERHHRVANSLEIQKVCINGKCLIFILSSPSLHVNEKTSKHNVMRCNNSECDSERIAIAFRLLLFFRHLYLPSSRTISRRWRNFFRFVARAFAFSCGGVGAVVVPFCIQKCHWMNAVACCVACLALELLSIYFGIKDQQKAFLENRYWRCSLLCIAASVSSACCNGQQSSSFLLSEREGVSGCVRVFTLLIFRLIKWYGLMPNKLKVASFWSYSISRVLVNAVDRRHRRCCLLGSRSFLASDLIDRGLGRETYIHQVPYLSGDGEENRACSRLRAKQRSR